MVSLSCLGVVKSKNCQTSVLGPVLKMTYLLKMEVKKPTVHSFRLSTSTVLTDLPLILILSVYTDFLTLKFGKIQIFPPKIRQGWATSGFIRNSGFFFLLSPFKKI